MARDRRRAKQRRERQARSGAPASRRAQGRDPLPEEAWRQEGRPAELASGEVDLAEARLAVGRSEPADREAGGLGGSSAGELIDATGDDGRADAGDRSGGDGGATGVARVRDRTPEPGRGPGGRFAAFLRGSWRELQRVQWPDRRQVAQATAVVVGFVLLAGVFLGGADWVSARIVDLIV